MRESEFIGRHTVIIGPGSLRLQRVLAALLGLFCLLLGVVVLAGFAALIKGDLAALTPLAVTLATAIMLGAVSVSLYQGLGLPVWFLRTLWLSGVVGTAFWAAWLLYQLIQGVGIGWGELYMLSAGIYFSITLRDAFWNVPVRGRPA